MENDNHNEIIDECIMEVKSLIRDNCYDHMPYWGVCSNCGLYYDYKTLPSPDCVIKSLEMLKKL